MAWLRRAEADDPRLTALFEESGRNVERSCLLLRDMLSDYPEHPELASALVECEHEGDRIAHDIIHRLNGENGGHIPAIAADWHALATALDEVAPAVALFHLHDNLGDRHGAPGPATVDPLRLDLHLPPGTGTVPWARIAASLRDHNAPLLLEVHPPHRPEAFGLATVTAELLAGR